MGREQEINTLVGFRPVDEGVQVRHCRRPVSPSLGEAITKDQTISHCPGPAIRPCKGQVMSGGA